MNEARPYASLSSGLLARKGSAKPAMRPQGFSSLEDLGWNDMGYDPAAGQQAEAPEPLPEHVPSSIVALTPAPRPVAAAEEPSVVAQQRAIAESFDSGEAEEEPEAESERPATKAEVVTLPSVKASAALGRKSAFTLRLDAERHLRLRLACAVSGRSAQQIVTGALDQALSEIPEIEALATRVPAAGAKRK